MKKSLLPLLLLFSMVGKSEEKSMNIIPAQELRNVSYGSDAEQKMDIYLPEGRNENTKTFILLHGGGWSGGSKNDFSYVVPMLKERFPDYAIVNMDYRLATALSPAFPKQVQDIEKVIQHLKSGDYGISNQFALIGASAGAHLAMLYSYKYDTAHEVKAVCNIVGPADFTDPFYANHPYFQFAALYLVGNIENRPEAAIEVSPALHVNKLSPPTILFYGGRDMMVPSSQAVRLKAKLDEFGVDNEYHVYAKGGHGNWDTKTMADFKDKLMNFLEKRF
ncbi:MAG: alpha/beta hydrolase [Flavobacterium sp.]|nr:MAG: alpha/beta hydrolase [Flavobacterium sp.]